MLAPAPSSDTGGAEKRRLDIEQALQWASRDKAPKMREDVAPRSPAAPTVHPMWRAGQFAGRIGNWNNIDSGFPLAMGEPHPDAHRALEEIVALIAPGEPPREGDQGSDREFEAPEDAEPWSF